MKQIILFILFTLVNLSSGLAQQPEFEWAKQLGGSGFEEFTEMLNDEYGNYYLSGNFDGSIDFDLGAGVMSYSSPGNKAGFILKLNSTGETEWVRVFSGTSNVEIKSISFGPSQEMFVAGEFEGTTDLDPGSGVFEVSNVGGSDAFIVKIDNSGNFDWAKTFTSGSVVDVNLVKAKDDYLCLTINFKDSIKVGFATGDSSYYCGTNGNGLVLKCNTAGEVLWAAQLSSPFSNYVGFDFNASDDIFLIGSYFINSDADPGPGVFTLSTTFSWYDAFIQKLSSTGEFMGADVIGTDFITIPSPSGVHVGLDGSVYTTGSSNGSIYLDWPSLAYNTAGGHWFKMDENFEGIKLNQYYATGAEVIYELNTDAADNSYLLGRFNSNIDLDPNPPYLPAVETGGFGWQDIFVVKNDSAGNVLWGLSFGSTEHDAGHDLLVGNSGDVVISGRFAGITDFDIDSTDVFNLIPTGSTDLFILKLTDTTCASKYVIIDSTHAISCLTGTGFAVGQMLNASGEVDYSWNTIPSILDSAIIADTAGVYTLTAVDSTGCSNSSSVCIFEPDSYSLFDLEAGMINSTFRPGVTSHIWIDAFNDGCDNSTGNLLLVLDSQVTLQYSSPSPTSISGDSLFWSTSSLTFDSTHFLVHLIVKTDTSAHSGEILCFDLGISPVTGDFDTTNNQTEYCDEVQNSLDPNTKSVIPAGECVDHLVEMDKELEYCVKFQNTGTAEAINIIVVDSISPFLDINSIKVLAQSHENLVVELHSGNVVKFRFDDIWLADSATNEAESHGYVVFQIDPLTLLFEETTVENKVDIFFDYNPPVSTNWVFNTFVSAIPIFESSLNVSTCELYVFNGIEYTESGTYTHIFESAVDECDSSVNLDLFIFDPTAAIIQVGPDLVASDGISYQWIDCSTGEIIVGQTNQTFTPTMNGSYSVVWTGDDCSDTSDCFIVDFIGTSAGDKRTEINVYPNPTVDGQLNILVPDSCQNGNSIVTIMNSAGRVVTSTVIASQNPILIQLPVDKGLYFVNFKSASLSETFRILNL